MSPAWCTRPTPVDRKSTRLNSSHMSISYAVFCLKKKKHIYHDGGAHNILNSSRCGDEGCYYEYLVVQVFSSSGKNPQTNSILARVLFFFFNDTATTEIYTLSLHDALPI